MFSLNLWCLCLHNHNRGPGGEGEFGGWGCFRVVGVPSVSKSPQSGDHRYGGRMWQVGGAWLTSPQCFLLVTSGRWLPLCCLTGSRLLLEVQQQWRCWGRAGFSSKMLLLPLTLRQAVVWGLRPDCFTATALVGVAVDAKLPLWTLSLCSPRSTSLTCSMLPPSHLPRISQVCLHGEQRNLYWIIVVPLVVNLRRNTKESSHSTVIHSSILSINSNRRISKLIF